MGTEKQKDILLSVKPAYASLLVDGVKTVELRRRFPTTIEPGTRCLIYSSSPIQKIIGECKIESVRHLALNELWKLSADSAMIPWDDFSKYFSGLESGYAIKVYGHIKYDEPRELPSSKGIKYKAPQSYRYLPSKDEPISI